MAAVGVSIAALRRERRTAPAKSGLSAPRYLRRRRGQRLGAIWLVGVPVRGSARADRIGVGIGARGHGPPGSATGEDEKQAENRQEPNHGFLQNPSLSMRWGERISVEVTSSWALRKAPMRMSTNRREYKIGFARPGFRRGAGFPRLTPFAKES
jgi:hypothetical protein